MCCWTCFNYPIIKIFCFLGNINNLNIIWNIYINCSSVKKLIYCHFNIICTASIIKCCIFISIVGIRVCTTAACCIIIIRIIITYSTIIFVSITKAISLTIWKFRTIIRFTWTIIIAIHITSDNRNISFIVIWTFSKCISITTNSTFVY